MYKKFCGTVGSGNNISLLAHMISRPETNFVFFVSEWRMKDVLNRMDMLLNSNNLLSGGNNIKIVELDLGSSVNDIIRKLKNYPGYDSIVIDGIGNLTLGDGSENDLSYLEIIGKIDEDLYNISQEEDGYEVIVTQQIQRNSYISDREDVLKKFKLSQLDEGREGVQYVLCTIGMQGEEGHLKSYNCDTEQEMKFYIN